MKLIRESFHHIFLSFISNNLISPTLVQQVIKCLVTDLPKNP
ncbi:hypothetical protein LDVICp004 [lymphocystis disease virus-China]|uniref:Uncharacterized protein n=1 Tax=lymphocystis disease virus-China TaxID=256729 RepID=Q678K5_9VIRU|nr:hypothetical protein LDVICp004 [lymphocystis disease virus-China]AAU10852.1 hypothetical protein [lymphocystis disease virus-China]